MFLSLLLGISVPGAGNAATVTDYGKTPVLFVHGSGLSADTWQPAIRHLAGLGYPPAYLLAVELYPRGGSNPRAARRYIKPAVERLLEHARREASRNGRTELPQQVDIVAHSMGAFSSRWYIAKLGAERVRRWISIAGANHGTNSLCNRPAAGDREMCPAFASDREANPVQWALNGPPGGSFDESPWGVAGDSPGIDRVAPDERRSIVYLTLRLEPDRWIEPQSSAELDGAGGWSARLAQNVPVRETSPGNYLFLGRVGHDALLRDRAALRFVAAALD